MSRKRTLGVGMILSAIVIFGMMVPAKADVISFNLINAEDYPGSGGLLSAQPAPYGVVTVNLINPTTAIVSFASSITDGNIYLFASTVGVEPHAEFYSVSDITMTNSGVGFSKAGPFQTFPLPQPLGNLGTFGVRIDNVPASKGPYGDFAYASDLVTFTLHDLSNPWTSASDVLKGNVDNGFGRGNVSGCVNEEKAV
jgi:hypothetical protein